MDALKEQSELGSSKNCLSSAEGARDFSIGLGVIIFVFVFVFVVVAVFVFVMVAAFGVFVVIVVAVFVFVSVFDTVALGTVVRAQDPTPAFICSGVFNRRAWIKPNPSFPSSRTQLLPCPIFGITDITRVLFVLLERR